MEEAITPQKEPDLSPIEKTELLLQKIEEANKQFNENLVKQERIVSRMMLGGKGEAGSVAKTEEQKQKEILDEEIKRAIQRFR